MVKRLCTMALLSSSTALAGPSWIELVPEAPGPYELGSSVDVEVLFHNLEGRVMVPMMTQLDFSATDVALGLPDEFHFELLPTMFEPIYTRFETMPLVALYAPPSIPVCCHMWVHEAQVWPMGTLQVRMPVLEGVYILDAANLDTPNTNRGAAMYYYNVSFTEFVTLHRFNGNLTGDQLAMAVVPEPGTMVLLSLGGSAWAVLRRRRLSDQRQTC